MKKKYLLGLAIVISLAVEAQNNFYVYMKNGSVVDYSVADVDSVVFVKNEGGGNPANPEIGAIQVTTYGGWFESGYAEWSSINDASNYNVYYKPISADDSEYKQIDGMLVRHYGSHVRADIPGLQPGSYSMKIVPVVSGVETGKPSIISFNAAAYNRDGFAHFNNSGVGAYNDNGTLKSDAVIIYVTEKNKLSLKQDVATSSSGNMTSCTGISAILSALQKGYETRPFCIRLIGKITAEGMTGSGDPNNLLVKASNDSRPVKNVTIEGIGEDATCFGFGIRAIRAHNLEIRNLAVMLFGDDGIAFETNNKYVWVHHNDIFYGAPGSDTDQAKGDGSLDLKNDSQYMTFSYNHFWDSGKMSLCGMKSETGPNYICYHHNWFDHSDSRHPRIRTMSVHIYNNYFDGVSKYGVGVTMGACAFVESNYYRNVAKPMLASLQGTDAKGEGTFSGENGGIIKSYNNYFTEKPDNFSFITHKDNSTSFDAYEASSGREQVPSSYKTVAGRTSYDNFDTNSTLMYIYTADEPEKIPDIVKSESGRMNGGDFKWTFNNSVDDTNYGVNEALKAAITAYQTSLISIYGE
jgi:pectate lyase